MLTAPAHATGRAGVPVLGAARQLADADRAAINRVLAAHPIAAAQVAERMSRRTRNGRLFGFSDVATNGAAGRALSALLWSGGQLTPVGADPPAVAAFAEVISGQPRGCASIVGPADAVLGLWEQLRSKWGPYRTIRSEQPLLLLGEEPEVAADPLVRQMRPDEFTMLYPASVAMYTEEVGVSPLGTDGGQGYRNRISELLRGGRTYARIVAGQVIFKAELAVVTRHTAQVQGVWVAPQWRCRGIAAAGLATVIKHGLRHVAPTISLYVNAYNEPARRVYDRLGFRQVGTFATVLF